MTSPKLLKFLQRWVINTVAVFVAAYIVRGIHYDGFPTLLVAAALLGILNAVLRPLLLLLALPLLILSLGLFFFVINGLLLWFVGYLVKGFYVEGFWPAFWGALIITFVTLFLNSLTGTGDSRLIVQRGAPPRGPDRHDGDGPVIDV